MISIKELQGLPSNNYEISLDDDLILKGEDTGSIIVPGTPIQFKQIRTDAKPNYTAATSSYIKIDDLDITFTPKRADSLLIIQWMINYESNHDTVLRVFKDNAPITTTGEEGENNTGSGQNYGFASPYYDLNDSSTPGNLLVQYTCIAGSLAERTYSIIFQSSTTTARTFYLNHCVANSGADAYENLVSTGIIWEITQ